MLLKPVDLTTALRPSLLPDETLLFVQDAVGLYEGKYKIPNYQNGHAYLTSHRVCYVSADEPRKYERNGIILELSTHSTKAGFLKSSAKITLYPKPPRRALGAGDGVLSAGKPAGFSNGQSSSPIPRMSSPLAVPVASPNPTPINATWICPICSFSNPVPSNFDPAIANPSSDLPPCLACGIKPPFTTVLKAAIAAAANRGSNNPSQSEVSGSKDQSPVRGVEPPASLSSSTSSQSVPCPRCTFVNHPSLIECEMCGASLVAASALHLRNDNLHRAESPAPLFGQSSIINTEITDCVKLSFRGGGEKIFHERLKGALVQRKWLLQSAPPVPQPSQSSASQSSSAVNMGAPQQAAPRSTGVGIAGLERRGAELRKKNEFVIGNAFEDLEALMASAKEVIALAESFSRENRLSNGESTEASALLSQSADALGMITTKDMLSSGSENLYVSELSRNLAEYLTDDRNGILRREGGIMSLIDLWAVFNRSRNGVELVSPSDFKKAAELWEKLKLPIRLRKFKSGLLVVQRYDWSDEKTIKQIQVWMEELRHTPPAEPVPWDWQAFGRGVTAQETARRFGWSVGVAAEELEMAEDRGFLCREEGIEGSRFWSNHISMSDQDPGAHILEHAVSRLVV
ncbi:Vacuolar protein-sorting-associated protein 36 [Paecilomyces lecythidis]|uniref:Vacuolar protein-sorting-associated protein 36 n=1 Tax=Paecilomyces lecythidis TaxID=3004212 RepID=A0ABR3Y936_9EURO